METSLMDLKLTASELEYLKTVAREFVSTEKIEWIGILPWPRNKTEEEIQEDVLKFIEKENHNLLCFILGTRVANKFEQKEK